MPKLFHQLIKETPFTLWQIDQIVIFDWNDGPIDGICQLITPKISFRFRVFAERRSDNFDERLYIIDELNSSNFQVIVSSLSVLGTPKRKIWTPIWQFPNLELQQKVEATIDAQLSSALKTNLLLQAQLEPVFTFKDCWEQAQPRL